MTTVEENQGWYHTELISWMKDSPKILEIAQYFSDNFPVDVAHYYIHEPHSLCRTFFFFFRLKEHHDLFKLLFDQAAIIESENNMKQTTTKIATTAFVNSQMIYGHKITFPSVPPGLV